MFDFNHILTNFETNVVMNFLLHTMGQEQRAKLRETFPVQYNKIYFPNQTEVK